MSRWLRLAMVAGYAVTLLVGAYFIAQRVSTEAPVEESPLEERAVILGINDVYRINGVRDGTAGGIARVRWLVR